MDNILSYFIRTTKTSSVSSAINWKNKQKLQKKKQHPLKIDDDINIFQCDEKSSTSFSHAGARKVWKTSHQTQVREKMMSKEKKNFGENVTIIMAKKQ